ncbi:hypothetical protein K461DRAFT_318423 [Myriangium duriaei CBS 260.36]|uniref:Uncharacterized protein n=1 Tax=Myriangium duriaei CBS 260.36 TaxID=1168546 RepID=A0A9P4MN02_9PEZI|nr:hypothetical protein K461DRAFT_318423 [Myriangium duriaei CBS 260.36]
MTSKLIPANPEKVMVLRKVTPEILTCSVPFQRFGRVAIGGRGTIVRMANGSLAVFSPVALTDEVKAQVAQMGTVKYITALDLEHHIFLEPWHKAYPEAKLIGPEELGPKREKQGSPLPFAHLWKKTEAPSVDAEFDKEFEYTYVHAHANKELVFNHKPTKTLIEADFMFNLPATEQMSKTGISPTQGHLTRLFIALNNTQGSAIWHKRFIWYALSARDRPGFNKSVSIIDGWDFKRIIPCHGDVIEDNGKDVFRKVFEWHLQAAGKKTV